MQDWHVKLHRSRVHANCNRSNDWGSLNPFWLSKGQMKNLECWNAAIGWRNAIANQFLISTNGWKFFHADCFLHLWKILKLEAKVPEQLNEIWKWKRGLQKLFEICDILLNTCDKGFSPVPSFRSQKGWGPEYNRHWGPAVSASASASESVVTTAGLFIFLCNFTIYVG